MSPMDWIGETLGGRYQIQELIGQGGMSSVYKALDPNLQRVVAIKMIHPHMSGDPKFTARFEDEARAVARLRHPNIVQVYDFNHDGDTFYMVQEFVPGETVQDLLHRLNLSGLKISPVDAARYAAGVCSAIDYAHNLGMIHRDIKPANIMIDERGQAILMDFGIVKLLQGDSHTTMGTIVGTISYMPPDLIRGEPPDARSDIYSLGVTLYEMLTGELPFKSDSAVSLMMMVQNNPVPDLHMLRSDLPEELVAIVKKSLAKTRAERFTTAGEMGTALHRVVASLGGGSTMRFSQSPASPHSRNAESSTTPTGSASIPTNSSIEAAQASPSAATDTISPPSGNGAFSTVHPTAPDQVKRRSLPTGLLVGVGVLLVLVLIAAGFFLRGSLARQRANSLRATPSTEAEITQQAAALVTVDPALAPTEPFIPTATLEPAATQPESTEQPSPSAVTVLSPTSPAVIVEEEVIPTDIPFLTLQSVELDDQSRYAVDFEILNPDKLGRGDHAIFYFNTTPRTQLGEPQEGFYAIYTEGSPFTGFKTTARPRNAVEMCGLISNFRNEVISGSGNCFPLPDVILVTAKSQTICRAGPGEEYPMLRILRTGYSAGVEGMSPNESWWYVRNPADSNSFCWVRSATTRLSGDISVIGLVQPPPIPTAPAADSALFVEITKITIDDQNRYVVEYLTHNYDEIFPGTHMHFFFDTTPPEKAGIDGGAEGHLMYAGPHPFTEYKVSDRPPGANSMCALVANSDHTVIFEPRSGNCFPLPDSP